MVFHPVFNGITFVLCRIHTDTFCALICLNLSSQATYQTIELTSSVDVETSNPDLLIIDNKQLPVNSHFNLAKNEEGNLREKLNISFVTCNAFKYFLKQF